MAHDNGGREALKKKREWERDGRKANLRKR